MQRTHLSAVLAAVVVVATVTGVTALATPAAAQSDDSSLLGDVVGQDAPDFTDDPGAWFSAGWSGLGGASDRALYWVRTKTPGFLSERFPSLASDRTAASEADAVAAYFNEHNATLLEYANQRANWSQNYTVELAWTLDGETATRYLVTNASDGNLTSARITSSTSRTVDHNVELCGYAAASSRDELQRFTEEFAEPGENVTPAYRARLGAKYGGNVETSLYPTEGDCNG